MATMKDKLRKPTTGAAAAAYRPAPKPYPKRLTLDLTEQDHKALRLVSAETDVPMADILRGALRVLLEDQKAMAKALDAAQAG